MTGNMTKGIIIKNNKQTMLIIPALLESFRSLKDKTMKLVFETNELTPEQLVSLQQNIQRFGYMAFKENQFKEKEKEMLTELKSYFQDKGKSKSQRLRAVMYRNWEQKSQGYDVFDDYYNANMERIITQLKNRLD